MAAPLACPAGGEQAGVVQALPAVAAALQPGRTLNILVIGSAPVLRPHAGPELVGFPAQLAETLRQAVPAAKIRVTVRGKAGWTAADMVAEMHRILTTGSFQLVVWQTGTVEAVHNLSPAEFSDALNDGIALADAAGANVILMDPQFSRFLRANTDLAAYEAALLDAGAMPGVVLFHRFDLMHAWVHEGEMDLERAPAAARAALADRLHACLGKALARLVLDGVAAARS